MVSTLVQIETTVLSIQEGGNNSLLLLFFLHFVLHEFASFSVLPTSRNLKND